MFKSEIGLRFQQAHLLLRGGSYLTNTLKANLKKKFSAIYSNTNIAEYVGKKSNAAAIEDLSNAIREKKKVILREYESVNSHSRRDRFVKPFGFTPNYIDVWAYDLEDQKNKVFKVSRIDFVDVTEESWTEEKSHRFVAGLAHEIKVVEGEELKEYLRSKYTAKFMAKT